MSYYVQGVDVSCIYNYLIHQVAVMETDGNRDIFIFVAGSNQREGEGLFTASMDGMRWNVDELCVDVASHS